MTTETSGMSTMLIGQFAQLTGLSVRTLRWYDEEGVLSPTHVDHDSRYRRYTLHQLDDAITIRTLRDAGVPLPTVLRVMDESDAMDASAAVDRARAELIERRAREDAALVRADHAIGLHERSWEITDRHEPAQAFVALSTVVPVPGTEDDQQLSETNERILRLMTRMQRVTPVDARTGWLSFGPGDDGTTVTVTVAQPVDGPPPDLLDALGDGATTGLVPARRELSLDRRIPVDEPDLLFDPGVLALIREAVRRGLHPDVDHLRQYLPVPAEDSGDAEPAAHVVRLALLVTYPRRYP